MRVYSQYDEANRKRSRNAFLITGGLAAAGAVAVYCAGMLADNQYGDAVAAQYLEQAGYSKVVPKGTDYRTPLSGFMLPGCDIDDVVRYNFDATAPKGARHVSRMVCKGIFDDPIIH